MRNPDLELLKRLFSYNPETGTLIWRERTEVDCPNPKERKRWNGRYAGKEAFQVKPNGYREGMIFRSAHKAHRVIWALHYGAWPEGDIDHINGKRSDNRIKNLRCVSRKENSRNQRHRTNNTTGVMGVYPHGKRWRVHLGNVHIGVYETIQLAAAARAEAERAAGYHPNHGRNAYAAEHGIELKDAQ